MFVEDCKHQLKGLQYLTRKNESYHVKKMYVDGLWNEANKKRVPMVTEEINTRRGTLYSMMINQFTGKQACSGRNYQWHHI